MKKTKILLSGLSMLLSSAVFGQVSYGIKGGVNLNKSTYEDSFSSDYKTILPSYYITGYADFAVSSNLSIQPGVSLQGKGDKYKFDKNGMDGEVSWSVMSIEIPVNLVYYIPTGDLGDVFLGAGPYVAANISGKQKVVGDVGGWMTIGEKDMKFTGDSKDQDLIDFGANFMLGYKLKNGFLINAAYGLGLLNLDANGYGSVKNRTLSFGIGYQF